METYRLWPRPLVVKGIIHEGDARRGAEIGGAALSYPITAGRQFDRALTAVQARPAIKRAVGDRLVIMLDGGIRRGSDIVTSLCLGTGFVFTRRAPL